MQYAPSQNLSKYIKHYLMLRIPRGDKQRYRHFANCHNGLVFSLDQEDIVSYRLRCLLPKVFVFGQVSKNQDFFVNGASTLIIVLFQPLGFFALTGIHASRFTDKVEDASLLLGNEVVELNETLFLCSEITAVAALNSFFIKKFNKFKYEYSPYVLNFITTVHKKGGNVSVHKLCTQLGVNQRKMQRLFSEQVGVSPKKFIDNAKLHGFLGLLKTKGHNGLTQLSLEAGYYDQAHLIRAFKGTVGFNPSTYIKSQRLAVNLIQV